MALQRSSRRTKNKDPELYKYDSDPKSSASGGEEESGEGSEEERVIEKARKRKKNVSTKASKPAKRAREDTGRKKKAKKDPNAPKKPLSAYMIWLQENRPMIKQKHPGASLGEIGKKAGELWKALDDKTEWDEKAKKARKDYDRVMEEYRATLGGAPSKPAKKAPASKKGKSGGAATKSSKKYTSAEYISDNESSEADAAADAPESSEEESD